MIRHIFSHHLGRMARILFEVSSALTVILFIAELAKTGLVTNYLNFNLVLILALASGITYVVFGSPKDKTFSWFRRVNQYFLAVIMGSGFGLMLAAVLSFESKLYIIIPWLGGISFGLTFLLLTFQPKR